MMCRPATETHTPKRVRRSHINLRARQVESAKLMCIHVDVSIELIFRTLSPMLVWTLGYVLRFSCISTYTNVEVSDWEL